MAPTSSKDVTHVLIGGYNVAGTLDQLSARISAIKREFQPLGAAWPTNLDTGMRNAELSFSGILDSPTADPVSAVNGTGRAVAALVEGNTVGAHCFLFQSAIVDGVAVNPDDGGIASFVPELTVSGKAAYGLVVGTVTARTTAGNTDATYADLGAAGPHSGMAVLQVPAITLGGYTSATIKLRHSTDHITFTDHTTFTVVSAIGSEYKALTSLNRYPSISWAWNGSGSGMSVTPFVGVAL